MRSLAVHIGQRRVGDLHEGDDLWRFVYNADWQAAEDGFDLAPGLPRARQEHIDGGTQRPVQWYFDNLLPEELLRVAISQEAHIRGNDAFALLTYLCAESAGSLTLLPPDSEMPGNWEWGTLPDEELSRRIAALPRQTLAAQAPKRMSLAGAQHKLLVVLDNGRLYDPVGATASTHILKPNHQLAADYPASVINEYVTMRLAAAAGLTVPAVHLRYVPDRRGDTGQLAGGRRRIGLARQDSATHPHPGRRTGQHGVRDRTGGRRPVPRNLAKGSARPYTWRKAPAAHHGEHRPA